jgi:hypothetical protein
MSSWIAAEILRILSPKRYKQISSFQSFVGSLVHSFGVQGHGLSVLSDLRLSCLYSHHPQWLKVRHAIKNLTETRQVGPKFFICYSTNNFDTKRGGENPDCVSQTISTVGVYKEGNLRKVGIFMTTSQSKPVTQKRHLCR